jgi:hypothetical protein
MAVNVSNTELPALPLFRVKPPRPTVTVYKFPVGGPAETTWFQKQLELLNEITMCRAVNEYNKKPDSEKKIPTTILSKWQLALQLYKTFIDKNGYTPVGVSQICREECNITNASDVINHPILSNPDKVRNIFDALLESISEYHSPFHMNDNRYLVTLHPIGHPEYVCMTMRVMMNFEGDPNLVEHRHIMTSLYSIIAPLMSTKYPACPGQMSIRFHQETAKIILKLHPNVRKIEVRPLRSMAEILQKAGFAKFDNIEDKQVNQFLWRYDYGALANGVTRDNMLDYFGKLLKDGNTGLDITDFKDLKVTEILTPDFEQIIPISKELIEIIADKLHLKK